MKFCAECVHYAKNAVTVGNKPRSACKREGARQTALEERNLGDCGLEGKHWESREP